MCLHAEYLYLRAFRASVKSETTTLINFGELVTKVRIGLQRYGFAGARSDLIFLRAPRAPVQGAFGAGNGQLCSIRRKGVNASGQTDSHRRASMREMPQQVCL